MLLKYYTDYIGVADDDWIRAYGIPTVRLPSLLMKNAPKEVPLHIITYTQVPRLLDGGGFGSL